VVQDEQPSAAGRQKREGHASARRSSSLNENAQTIAKYHGESRR